eukprot:1197160-Rhodomonas_salina.1
MEFLCPSTLIPSQVKVLELRFSEVASQKISSTLVISQTPTTTSVRQGLSEDGVLAVKARDSQ